MRVQITKCEREKSWYYNKIGEAFLAEPDKDGDYILFEDEDENSLRRCIRKHDCIILNDDDHMPKHIREVEETPGGSTDAQILIAKECDKVKEIIMAKNRKYGNSAIEPCRVFSKASPLEQIDIRLDDKLSRLISGQADEDEDIELDLIGYLMLKRIAKKWHEIN